MVTRRERGLLHRGLGRLLFSVALAVIQVSDPDAFPLGSMALCVVPTFLPRPAIFMGRPAAADRIVAGAKVRFFGRNVSTFAP